MPYHAICPCVHAHAPCSVRTFINFVLVHIQAFAVKGRCNDRGAANHSSNRTFYPASTDSKRDKPKEAAPEHDMGRTELHDSERDEHGDTTAFNQEPVAPLGIVHLPPLPFVCM